MPDPRFKLVVAGAAGALVAGIVFLRFCGALDLPPKPPRPADEAIGRATDIMSESAATPAAWQMFLEQDARAAGLPAASPAAMARVLPYVADTTARSLRPGQHIDVAGLRLGAEITDGEPRSLALVIENLGEIPLAYRVATRPSVHVAICHGREVLPYNAHVVGPRERERRTECAYRDNMAIEIDGVETMQLLPLQAFYLSRVPPAALTTDPRLTRGHMPRGGGAICNVMMSQAIRSGVEKGQIQWRDLVDFYARHRCESYAFPEEYKAFTKDGERSLPAGATIP